MYKQGDRVAYVSSSDQTVVDKYRDNEGNYGVAVVRYARPDGFIAATMVSGNKKDVDVLFTPDEIVPSMKIVSAKRSTEEVGLKVYGKILGEHGKTYNFAYIRRFLFRGWICSCEDFFFNRFKKGQNCKHLHYVREQLGRYGTKLNSQETA